MKTADYWIKTLQLTAHPEGGYFKEVYRSKEIIPASGLPARYQSERSMGTSIYFLLQSHNFSAFHRIKSDEVWHFYAGGTVVLHVIDTEGMHSSINLGNDPDQLAQFQCVIPHGCWFAAHVPLPDTYALVGCTVSPGFDFSDFELADRSELIEQYPQYRELITMFTRV